MRIVLLIEKPAAQGADLPQRVGMIKGQQIFALDLSPRKRSDRKPLGDLEHIEVDGIGRLEAFGTSGGVSTAAAMVMMTMIYQ